MLVLTKEELSEEILLHTLQNSDIFIYPTDTIYGIGCDATDEKAVKKLREVKQMPKDKPLSIIAPSKNWIFDNCEITGKTQDWVDKLPGQYTLILKLKNKHAVAKGVTFNDTIGVRIPEHWISDLVEDLGIPIVTTSANVSGETYMHNLDDLNEDLKKAAKFIIFEGEKKGSASTIVHLEIEDLKIRKR